MLNSEKEKDSEEEKSQSQNGGKNKTTMIAKKVKAIIRKTQVFLPLRARVTGVYMGIIFYRFHILRKYKLIYKTLRVKAK